MAKRILVPLDQSVTGESVLPLVADLARGSGATVRLLTVMPEPLPLVTRDGRVVAYADQELVRLEAEGMDYLRAAEARLDGVPVECVVRFGEPDEAILEEARAFDADLIAVTTTGRSGIGRVAFGSVAEAVFRKADVAVVLFHPSRWPSRGMAA
jgi:nucleotide-binding universal stress UspA family protein